MRSYRGVCDMLLKEYLLYFRILCYRRTSFALNIVVCHQRALLDTLNPSERVQSLFIKRLVGFCFETLYS